MVGDGVDIVSMRDLWLNQEQGFKVEDSHMYVGRN